MKRSAEHSGSQQATLMGMWKRKRLASSEAGSRVNVSLNFRMEDSDNDGCSQSESTSSNTLEMEETEHGSDSEDPSISGSSTSCSTSTTPPPELTPKGLSALLSQYLISTIISSLRYCKRSI